jgi:hypothetical protein
MSQFFGQQLLAAQYFRPQYLHGAGGTPTQDGRSGYWRLFYYHLQEEELKKHEQKQSQKTAQGTGKTAVETSANGPATGKPAPKPRPKYSSPQPVVENTPVFKSKSLYVVPRIEYPSVGPLLQSISRELTSWTLQSQEKGVQFAQKQATNEEEELITLLLLAA